MKKIILLKIADTSFKNKLPPDDYELISLDVASLFVSVPLDYTINIILKWIYDQRELEIKISR